MVHLFRSVGHDMDRYCIYMGGGGGGTGVP